VSELVAAFDAAHADFIALSPLLWDPLGQILVQHSAPRPGERVLDACCGAGASALPAARAVGADGQVDAVDLAGALLDHGRAAAQDLPHLRFIQGDVSTWRPTGDPYDLVQSAYGVFFLPDMDTGSKHLITLLRHGGRFAIQTWRHGALTDFARCMLDAIADEAPHPIEPPASASASERIDSETKLHDWLSSLGLVDVHVRDVPFKQPLTPELAWNLVRGTGWRGLLTGFDEAAAERIRNGLIRRIEDRDLTEFDAGSLIGIGART
jgi:trans-aconitate methyltransferase